MRVFSVLYMEAEKRSMVFNFLSNKLMLAAKFVLFCLNPFWREVHEASLPHDKNDSDKTVHNLQLTSA